MWIKTAQFILIIVFSPFLFGVINRTKAFFAGRKGQPLLQLYYDIFKLFRKGAVYSVTTTWLFVAGPIISLSAVLVAAMMVPFAGSMPLLSFDGDIVLFIYLLGLARFFTVIAALDTGSSFEGMGAAREVEFAVFAEPVLFLSLSVLARVTGEMSLYGIFSDNIMNALAIHGPLILLLLGSLFIVFLCENSRIPVDDPNTHLELTMIHEAMILDHSGVDLAYVFYAGAIKFWILGMLLTNIFFGQYSFGVFIDSIIFIISMVFLAIVVGVVESTLARLRLLKVPHYLIIGLSLSIVALILSMRSF